MEGRRIEEEEETVEMMVPRLSARERRLADLLTAYSFSSQQVRDTMTNLRYKTSSLYEFEPETVRQSLEFWIRKVVPRDKSPSFSSGNRSRVCSRLH